MGTGKSTGNRHIDPVTEAFLEEDSSLTMDTVQISGVDTTYRKTSARLAARAKLLVRERLMTDGAEAAKTEFTVHLEGEDSGADLVSRSVARGRSPSGVYFPHRGLCALHGPFRVRRHSGGQGHRGGHARVGGGPPGCLAHP